MLSFFDKMTKEKTRLLKNQQAGFSLIEMLVVVSIFTIVTAVVLANLPSFRDQSSLDLVAQEVAIQIRGAQTYAMSSLYDTNPEALDTSLLAYAIVFDKATPQAFNLRYTSSGPTSLYCQADLVSKPKENYLIKGNFEIGGLCQGGDATAGMVSICFKRPNGQLWQTDPKPSPSYSIMVWSKADHSKRRFINVSNNGQIYVDPSNPITGCSFP